MARVYNTSFEQLALSGIFDLQVGSTASLDAVEQRTGSKSLKFHKTGAASGSKRTAEANSGVAVGRFAFKMNVHPDAGTQFILILVGSGGTNFNIRVDTTGKLTAIFGATGAQTLNGGASIIFDRWYVIDYRVDLTGTTYTCDWRVDGVAQTQVTRTGMTPGTVTTYTWDGTGPNTIDFWVDDWTYSHTGADYPLADQSEAATETLAVGGTATPSLAAESFQSSGFTDAPSLSATATPSLSKELQVRVETLVCAANAPPRFASEILTTSETLKVNLAATPSLVDPVELLTATAAATPAFAIEQYVGGGGGWGPAVIWSGGGEMTVAINPANPLKMIVGGDTSGIKISSDGGKSWRMANASMRTTAAFQVASVAYHPDGSKAWALVGGSSSGTLLETSDDGLTWTDVAASQSGIFGCGNGKGDFPSNSHPRSVGRLVCVDPTNGYIYVATYKHGVWRAQLSNVAGTWTQIAMFESGGNFYYCRSLIFGQDVNGDPDYDVLYVGCSDVPAISLQGFVTRILTPRGTSVRQGLSAAPVNPNRITAWNQKVIASATGGGDEGIFVLAAAKTAAGTDAWLKLWTPPAGSYVNAIVRSGNTIICGLDNPGTATFNAPVYLLTSSDNFTTAAGVTATPKPGGNANVTDQIYGGHGHYALYEVDNTRILGKKNFYISDIAVAGTKIVVTGPGSNISDDFGSSWAASVFGMLDIGGRRMRSDPILPSRVYMSNTDRQLYCSLDRFAATFTTAKPGSGSMGTDIGFDTWSKTAAAMASTGSRVYLAVSDRDTNTNGEVWFADDPFTGPWTSAISVTTARCISIQVCQDDAGQTIVLGFFHDTGSSNTTAGIYRKVGAAAATKIKAAGASGLLQSDGKKSASSDWRPGHAVWYFDGHSGVWRSTDFGLTWTLAFPETSSNDDSIGYVVCHPTDPSKVYVSTKTKVYLLSNALAAPASIVATDITGSLTAPGAIAATPDGTVVVAERATSAHTARLWTWQAGAEGLQVRADDSYYQGLAGFPHDLARSTDGQLYTSTDGAGMGRTSGTGGGVTEQKISLRGNATPKLISEVYVPTGTALIETLVLPAVVSGKIPTARVRQLVGFGNDTPDNVGNVVTKDSLVAARFTAPNLPGGFDLVGIRARMDNPNALASKIKGVVYTADGSDPSSQASAGATPEVAVAASSAAAWYETLFASPRRLASGDDFYLSLLVGENARLYGGAPANVRTVATPYTESAPPPPGTAIWGVAKSENLGDPDSVVQAVETAQGRIFAGIRKNYGTGNNPLISGEITRSFDYGRKWTYMNGKPSLISPDTNTSGTFWRSIANGLYDTVFNTYFAAIRANGRWTTANPYNYSWHHEQYITSEPPGGANAGVAADYIDAHRHVWQLLQDGNFHVSKGGCITLCFVPQWQQFFRDPVYGVASLATGPAGVAGYTFTDLNPGAAYYDILGADIYVPRFGVDGLTGVQDATRMFKPVHDACVAMGKPMIVPEVGIANERGASYQVAYLQELMDLLVSWGGGQGPGQFAGIFWTHKNSINGDYRMDFLPEALAQYCAMANTPFFSRVVS